MAGKRLAEKREKVGALACGKRVESVKVRTHVGNALVEGLALVADGVRGVWWGRGDLVEELRRSSSRPHDVFFRIAVSDYGTPHVELRVVAIR